MRCVDFPEANTKFRPPPGVRDEDCGTAPSRVQPGGALGRECITCWELDDADLAILTATRKLYVFQVGGMMPHYATASPTWRD